ncbi:hypothetical protein NECAME_10677 [Necator americanus]|uniref:Uncharacterized protein n=1 Tax=Necator americanus TaxID=51031 RepID=W2T9R2_NECAM|nr:hypothetical protein NECAME_10677 [Necator americanus]ETN77946.1 hypothetical protein NECAME_10677 [Necator americanus]
MRTHPDTSDRSRWLETSKDTPHRKISSNSMANTLSRLTSRLTINPSIRWTPASKINHDTVEGRIEFYNQIVNMSVNTTPPFYPSGVGGFERNFLRGEKYATNCSKNLSQRGDEDFRHWSTSTKHLHQLTFL